MTKSEILDKFERIEGDVKVIKEYLSQNKSVETISADSPLAVEPDFKLGYTLEDLYREFGGKVSLAHRLKSALQKRNINTLEEFLLLTPGELLELGNVGYDTLLRTKKALNRLGVVW
ncbi:MAG: hypothetical protein AUK64_2499 [bacterium P201]|nr:MAG: hypothetical protein AUK64_2499 [bacterium P201]